MSWPKIALGFLGLLGAMIVLRNGFHLMNVASSATNPAYNLSFKAILILQPIFWVILGVLLLIFALKRSRLIVPVTLTAAVYLCVSFTVTLASLGQLYRASNFDGSVSSIIFNIAATAIVQIILAFAVYGIARTLRKTGHVT